MIKKWKRPEGTEQYDHLVDYPGRAEELANDSASVFSNAVVALMRAEVTAQYKLLAVLRREGLLLEPDAPADEKGAAALKRAASFYEKAVHQVRDPHADPRYWAAILDVAQQLRARANRTTDKDN